MLDKPNLLKWANKIGREGISLDDYRAKAKESGITIHEHIENFVKHGLLSGNDELDVRIQKFFSDKEVISVEHEIENDYFVGRYDIKLRWQNLVFICDYKSNSGVYFETKLQLAAYKMADQCDHVAVIHLPELIIRPIDLKPEHESFIILLSKVYELKNKIENSK